MRKILLFILFAISSFASQYKTIETPAVRVVYEKGFEEEAQKTANYINSLRDFYIKDGYKGKLKQIPLILHKGNSVPNGFTSFGPWKMEFETISPLNNELGVSPWLLDLSIHEYRHYAQFRLLLENKSMKSLKILFGQTVPGYVSALTIPNWIFEGDAVYYETKLSENGRGRTPDFLKQYKMLLNEKGPYSYEKAKSGSYKDVVPSIYHLGYLLISYGYEKYGDKFWDDIITKSAIDFSLTPYSKNIKAKTGLSSTEFYNAAMSYYKEKFKLNHSTNYNSLLENLNSTTEMSYAYSYKDGFVSLISDLDSGPAFYFIKNNEKRKIVNTGYIIDNYYELKANKLIWSQYIPNKINGEKFYSEIKLLDLETNQIKDITKDSYYQSPTLSNDGQKIAVIKHNGYEDSTIEILDLSGNILQTIKNTKSYLYNYLKWTADDSSLIVSLRNNEGKMALEKLDLSNENEDFIINFDNYTIGTPFVLNDDIYFNGAFENVENIYKININKKILARLTESNYSARKPTVYNNTLYFTDYGSQGEILKSLKLNETPQEVVKETKLTDDSVLNLDSLKNSKFILAKQNLNSVYDETNYNYLKHMINIHSWNYLWSSDSSSFGLYSTNELQDLDLALTWSQDKTNEKEDLIFQGRYQRHWPIIGLDFIKGKDKTDNTKTLDFQVYFPIYLYNNQYQRKLQLSLGYIAYEKLEKENLMSLGLSLFNSNFDIGKKDLGYAFAQIIKANYIYNIEDSSNKRLNLNFALQSKGFSKNDSFTYQIDYEKNYGYLQFDGENIISRGYKSVDYDLALKNSFDYNFPISYPDWGGRGYFLQRITGNIFYDNTIINSKTHYNSTGFGLNFDQTLFSLLPISYILQYQHLFENSEDKVVAGFSIKM